MNAIFARAGLAALALLARIRGYPREKVRTPYYAKGNYFACHGVKPFKHLVYPMPNNAGLGVHATLDLDGTTRFGPDVEWVDQPEYSVDASRADSFYAAIREYWPTSLMPPRVIGPMAPMSPSPPLTPMRSPWVSR